jgi:Zn-dependent M28 family amino/carboxypeptidase
VVGLVRAGAPDRKPGAVVIGAHYDHLGLGGGPDSRDPGVAAPHNGADDNASGTAALLEIGRRLVAKQVDLPRDVYLVAFTAEEMGLLGAKHFVANLPGKLGAADIVGMINLDMVGRMRQNRVFAFGTDTAAEWAGLVAPACREARIHCQMDRVGGHGPSDHSAFYLEKIPVLYFFTGNHEDYHRTSDDADRVHAGGGAQIAQAASDIAVATARLDGRLTYQAVPSSMPQGDRRAWKSSLGTMPSYSQDGIPGVLLDGVIPGGAAERAGLTKGDRIVKIGRDEIRSVSELMYQLETRRPGEKATLVYLRDGARKTTEVVFGKSRGRRGGGHPPRKD